MASRKRADISALPSNSPLIFNRLLLSVASRVKTFCLFTDFYSFCIEIIISTETNCSAASSMDAAFLSDVIRFSLSEFRPRTLPTWYHRQLVVAKTIPESPNPGRRRCFFARFYLFLLALYKYSYIFFIIFVRTYQNRDD